MNAFILLTNRLNLSIAIKEYFCSMSPINYNNVRIFNYGLDKSSEYDVLASLSNDVILNKKFTNYFIFCDFGDSLDLARKFQKENKNVYVSKGSLIETGFLNYKLINGGAPIESIMLGINKTIKK